MRRAGSPSPQERRKSTPNANIAYELVATMDAPLFSHSAREKLNTTPHSRHNGSLLQGHSVTSLDLDTYVSAVRPGTQDVSFGDTPLEKQLLSRSVDSDSWWVGEGAKTRPDFESPLAPGSDIISRAHKTADLYTLDDIQMPATPMTHGYSNMYPQGNYQMPPAPIANGLTDIHGSLPVAIPSQSNQVTTSSHLLHVSSRYLMRAFEVITGKPATDDTVCNYTQEQVVQAVMDGNAYISRGGVLNPTQAARVNGYIFNAENHSLRRLDTLASRDGHLSTTYPVQVDQEWIIHVKIPRDLVERPFERRKGGGAWFPPEGLLYMAVGYVGLHMDHFDVNGSTSPIHSQAAPGQVDIRLLGALQITAYELAVWFPTHGRDWEDWSKRLAGNGWSPTQVARLANKARATDETKGILKSTIENQFSKHAPLATRTETEVFSCDSWTAPGALHLIDYHVRHLATGVGRNEFPSGADRGPVTAAIEYVLDHPEHLMLKLGEVEEFVAQFGLDTGTTFVSPASGLNLDRDAIGRLERQLTVYRKLCEQRRKNISS